MGGQIAEVTQNRGSVPRRRERGTIKMSLRCMSIAGLSWQVQLNAPDKTSSGQCEQTQWDVPYIPWTKLGHSFVGQKSPKNKK